MKTKLIAATIALSSLFTAGASQAAIAIYNYDANNQITSLSHITGLMVDNVSYDISFSDIWDGIYVDYDLAKDITDALSSALEPYSVSATNSGVNAGTLDSTRGHIVEFDMRPELTGGCDTNIYLDKCDMYLITDKEHVNFDGTGTGKYYGYYVSNDDKSQLDVDRGWDDNDSRNYRGGPGTSDALKTIQAFNNHIVDYTGGDNTFDGENARFRTFMSASLTDVISVPEPSTAMMLGTGLMFMGVAAVRRRKKKDA